jgi:hypothetical protein
VKRYRPAAGLVHQPEDEQAELALVQREQILDVREKVGDRLQAQLPGSAK